jgi:hypothetical protein
MMMILLQMLEWNCLSMSSDDEAAMIFSVWCMISSSSCTVNSS